MISIINLIKPKRDDVKEVQIHEAQLHFFYFLFYLLTRVSAEGLAATGCKFLN